MATAVSFLSHPLSTLGCLLFNGIVSLTLKKEQPASCYTGCGVHGHASWLFAVPMRGGAPPPTTDGLSRISTHYAADRASFPAWGHLTERFLAVPTAPWGLERTASGLPACTSASTRCVGEAGLRKCICAAPAHAHSAHAVLLLPERNFQPTFSPFCGLAARPLLSGLLCITRQERSS